MKSFLESFSFFWNPLGRTVDAPSRKLDVALGAVTFTALIAVALMIGCARLHGQKQPYRMNNEDHEHWFRIEYQKKLMTQPLDDEEKQLLGSNCAKAGYVFGFNCAVHQDGTIVEGTRNPDGTVTDAAKPTTK